MEIWILIIPIILTFKIYFKTFEIIIILCEWINKYILFNKIITIEFIKSNISNLIVILIILLWIILFLTFYLIYYVILANKLNKKLNNEYSKILNFCLYLVFYLPIIFIFLEVNIAFVGIIVIVVSMIVVYFFKYKKENKYLNKNFLLVFKLEIEKIFRIDSNENYLKVKKC